VRVLRFRWGMSRRRCGDGGGAIDEANVGVAPWRWRTGRLIRRDNEIDDRSSSGAVDEGCRAVVVDDVVREGAPAGRWSDGGRRMMGFHGFWRPRCMNGGRAWGEPWLGDALVRNVG
jgi:hypothetical protein